MHSRVIPAVPLVFTDVCTRSISVSGKYMNSFEENVRSLSLGHGIPLDNIRR